MTENLRRRIPDGHPDGNDHADEDQKGDHTNELAYGDANNVKLENLCMCQWWRVVIARNGWPSLLFAVAALPSLHFLLFYRRLTLGVPSRPYNTWLPFMAWSTNVWLLVSSFIVGLCSFIAWAEAGNEIRRKPMTVMVMVLLHLVYFSLRVAWDPVTIDLGAVRAGILISLVRAACGVAIGRMLRKVNFNAGKCVIQVGGLLSYYVFRHTLDFLDAWKELFK
ncbi:hypothetical protein Vadar_018154 [Vaccinium darrowii]|uniref:Uncharacterized protein n=1 Tax=Vaccinium darrowii TaxID=229202 RepID=A0ACB7YEE8_9ERIC|nr:hypothetical protein Vadar_018154 [Vaccinium darrowii]